MIGATHYFEHIISPNNENGFYDTTTDGDILDYLLQILMEVNCFC